MITGINIGKVDKRKKDDDKNKITFKSAFPNVNKSGRLEYCKEIFVDDKIQIERCVRPHIFCKYKCDSVISKIQNLINYSCYVDCVRQTKVELIATAAVTKTDEAKKDPPVNFMTWVPTLNAKCDYKPEGLNTFVNCVVKGLTESEKKKFATIEYQNIDGTQRKVNVEYPNVNLLQCGKGLKVRTDCN